MKKMPKFLYIPRVTIVPRNETEARISDLVRYCREYKYDEVMFFINAENLYRGFIEPARLKLEIEVIKRAKFALQEFGIKTSLNPWTTIGHLERGQTLRKDLDFAFMTDCDGKASKLIPCPLCKTWQKYTLDYFTLLVEEIEPETIWVEDDFRLHNHDPLHWGGCFCNEHMQLYSAALDKKISREEFVEKVLQNADGGKYRRAFYHVNRKVMRDLAVCLGAGLHSKRQDLTIGLMSSDPKMHSIEGRDWTGILCGLDEYEPTDRIHLPMYRQGAMQDYCWDYNDISMQTRALIPEKTKVLPEIENAMFSPYTKSVKSTLFQVESSLSLCPAGITLDLDCFAGNGIVAEYGYGTELAKIKEYLNAFLDLGLRFSDMDGIVIPCSEDMFLRSDPCNDLNDLHSEENWWASYFACCGIAFRYSKEKEWNSRTVAVSGNWLNSLTDTEVIELFKSNFLLLDGKSVKILFERKLNYLINSKSYRFLQWEKGDFSFEEAAPDKQYLNINKCRASATVTTPGFYAIDYEGDKVHSYTKMFDNYENFVSDAIVASNNFMVLPYQCRGKSHGLLHSMRVDAIKDALKNAQSYSSPIIYSEKPYLALYYFRGKTQDVLFFSNFSDDDYSEVSINGLYNVRSVQALQRDNGKWLSVNFCSDKKTTINYTIKGYSTATFIIHTS